MSTYVMANPTGKEEQARLDIQHQIWMLTLGNRLHATSLPRDVSSILDLGCGTGIWSLAMATNHPSAHIIGLDLTWPQLDQSSLPPNVTLVKANAEQDWPIRRNFDFIHARMLVAGIRDWPGLLSRCKDHLNPGGQLELLDTGTQFGSLNPSVSVDSSPFLKFGQAAERGWAAKGIDTRTVAQNAGRLREGGFVEVSERVVQLPLGPWGELEDDRHAGELQMQNFQGWIGRGGADLIANDGETHLLRAQEIVEEALWDLRENWRENRYYVPRWIITAVKLNTG